MPGFHAYIDESGHEGGSYGEGASEWFALSAFVTKADNDISQAFNQYNERLRKPAGYRFLKYQKLNDKNKIVIAQILGQLPSVRVAHILIHKPSLNNEQMKRDHTRLYKYACRFLLERVSWICRDARHPPADPMCHVTFSERRGFPYSEIVEYLRRLRGRPQCRIAWNHLDETQIATAKHAASDGCRLADVTASSITQALEYTELQITDDRPIRRLPNVTYKARHSEQLRGNGIKIFPREAEGLADTDPRFAWLRNHYPP